jgi:uncharacterized protein
MFFFAGRDLSAMIVDLTTFESGKRDFSFVLPADKLGLQGEGIVSAGDISVNGTIERAAGRTKVEGRIEGRAEVECSRCLIPVTRDIAIEFSVDFVDGESFASHSGELTDTELDTDVLVEHEINLADVAREQIVLDKPEQVFCRDDCRGLCQKCGANRNLVNCNCRDDEIDPRWSALKGLK